MAIGPIGSERIQSMLSQLRTLGGSKPVAEIEKPAVAAPSTKVDFSALVKSALDRISETQSTADGMQQRFIRGDQSVSLSDAMISSQKASVLFQGAIQVRNKLISAYEDMMRMSI